MSIQVELSSDIAVALLTGRERSAAELNNLKEVIFTVHDTLRKLTLNSRHSSAGKRDRNEKKLAAGERS
ncbi:MAG: hypothetical protein ACXW18_04945, partial [Pyrinomonadaceae bacterium]